MFADSRAAGQNFALARLTNLAQNDGVQVFGPGELGMFGVAGCLPAVPRSNLIRRPRNTPPIGRIDHAVLDIDTVKYRLLWMSGGRRAVDHGQSVRRRSMLQVVLKGYRPLPALPTDGKRVRYERSDIVMRVTDFVSGFVHVLVVDQDGADNRH